MQPTVTLFVACSDAALHAALEELRVVPSGSSFRGDKFTYAEGTTQLLDIEVFGALEWYVHQEWEEAQLWLRGLPKEIGARTAELIALVVTPCGTASSTDALCRLVMTFLSVHDGALRQESTGRTLDAAQLRQLDTDALTALVS